MIIIRMFKCMQFSVKSLVQVSTHLNYILAVIIYIYEFGSSLIPLKFI